MEARDLEPAQFRAAVYTPALKQLPTAQVLGGLLGSLQQFSGDPIVLPIPTDAPSDIPRIILKAPEEGLELQLALSRTDLYTNARPGIDLRAEGAFENATAVLESVLTVLGVRPGRLAAIGSYFYRCDEPASVLSEHFSKPEWVAGPLAELSSFELHAQHKTVLLEGLMVNSWVRCKTGEVTETGRSSRAIIVERDVNTLAEEAAAKEFTPEDVSGFMRRGSEVLGEELSTFFPGEES